MVKIITWAVGIALIGSSVALAARPFGDKVVMDVEYPEPKNKGVLTISAGSEGYYIWDSRFSLCFFRTGKQYDASIVQVPCDSLDTTEARNE